MLIDWFTAVAQVINFLVLVWLLKRFLFKPIVSAMQAREQRIAGQLRDAEEREKEAKAQSDKLRISQGELDQNKQTVLHQAELEAGALRQRLSEEARKEIETLRKKWQETLRDEQVALGAELSDRVQREVFAIVRQVLRDLAGAELERQIVTGFIGRLRMLDTGEKQKLIGLLAGNNQPTLVRSAFALPIAARAEIEGAVAGLQPGVNGKRIEYEIAPELLGGIELAAAGRKISWSIADYLASLERNVLRSINRETPSDEHTE